MYLPPGRSAFAVPFCLLVSSVWEYRIAIIMHWLAVSAAAAAMFGSGEWSACASGKVFVLVLTMLQRLRSQTTHPTTAIRRAGVSRPMPRMLASHTAWPYLPIRRLPRSTSLCKWQRRSRLVGPALPGAVPWPTTLWWSCGQMGMKPWSRRGWPCKLLSQICDDIADGVQRLLCPAAFRWCDVQAASRLRSECDSLHRHGSLPGLLVVVDRWRQRPDRPRPYRPELSGLCLLGHAGEHTRRQYVVVWHPWSCWTLGSRLFGGRRPQVQRLGDCRVRFISKSIAC